MFQHVSLRLLVAGGRQTPFDALLRFRGDGGNLGPNNSWSSGLAKLKNANAPPSASSKNRWQ
jgi:hypothetical protein